MKIQVHSLTFTKFERATLLSSDIMHFISCIDRKAQDITFYKIKCIFIQFIVGPEHTVCPGSSDPFYIVNYYMNW